MTLHVEANPINPFHQGLRTLKGEDSDLSRAISAEQIETEVHDLSRESRALIEDLCTDLEVRCASKSFLDAVTGYVNHETSPEKTTQDAEEDAAAKRTASNLVALCQLMARLNEILTNLHIQSTEMHFSLREPQRKAYEEQKKSYTIKAFTTLGGGVLGGASQIVGAGFGDTGRAIGEGLGKVFPAVGNCVTTLEDGKIQGEHAYEIKIIETDISQDQSKLSSLEQTTRNFWQTLQTIFHDIAQTSHIAAQG